MKFYGREREIAALRNERKLSHENARFTVITGRRFVQGALNRGNVGLCAGCGRELL